MNKTISLKVVTEDHQEVVLKNKYSDTFTYDPTAHEGLHDFLRNTQESEETPIVQAFPFHNPEYKEPFDMPMSFNGMDLRDYFAAKVLNGLVGHERFCGDLEADAEYSYKAADAMLKARTKTPQP